MQAVQGGASVNGIVGAIDDVIDGAIDDVGETVWYVAAYEDAIDEIILNVFVVGSDGFVSAYDGVFVGEGDGLLMNL